VKHLQARDRSCPKIRAEEFALPRGRGLEEGGRGALRTVLVPEPLSGVTAGRGASFSCKA
jgi:hypothetical protein